MTGSALLFFRAPGPGAGRPATAGRGALRLGCSRSSNSTSSRGGRPFDQLIEQGQLEPLQGAKLEVSQAKGGVLVNDIEILKPDIVADNGVIHVIGGLRAPEKQIKPALNSSNEESPHQRENEDLASTLPGEPNTAARAVSASERLLVGGTPTSTVLFPAGPGGDRWHAKLMRWT